MGAERFWNDPFKPGRDGSQGLAQVIEMHSPLALIILMLGTNDFQIPPRQQRLSVSAGHGQADKYHQ